MADPLPDAPTETETAAARLLEAQVAWVVDGLVGARTPDALAADVDLLLDLGAHLTLADVADPDVVADVVCRILVTVPPSPRATAVATTLGSAVAMGPESTFTLAEVVRRERVEDLARRLLARVDVLESALDRATRSPQATRLAGTFVGRLVGEVVQANRAVAEKIPGVGSLVSFGARAGGRVLGAAEGHLESLLGDTTGKGAALAARRLNKVVADTLRDPAALEAVLELYDLYATTPLPPATPPDRASDPDALVELADLLHVVVAEAAAAAPVHEVVRSTVHAVLAAHGDVPLDRLLAELGLDRDALVAHAGALLPPLAAAAHRAGRLEDLVRRRLAPFYASSAVAEILGSRDPGSGRPPG
ncbi:hypothetical protein RDV89_06335 [Nocardioides zeae]|uniref:DUF222 domain-containing protein n=1 Tax=Nocardioides imazamoxiresistens TaxID=3231893 RepID=A0ABU3PTW9_9ACTN|nr:hypothetical protein [Nocardioides zeae]MDT9592675.1 hypothetical protein [Nocardioides zeae]